MCSGRFIEKKKTAETITNSEQRRGEDDIHPCYSFLFSISSRGRHPVTVSNSLEVTSQFQNENEPTNERTPPQERFPENSIGQDTGHTQLSDGLVAFGR